MQKILFNENERLEELGFGGLRFIQNKELYCFTSDAVLLANFANTHSRDIVCDFCTGSGIVATIIAGKNQLKKMYAIEIQEQMFELAKRNIELNGLKDTVEVVNTSVQNYSKSHKDMAVDVIVCNPPYKKANTSFKNDNESKAIARHEIKINMEELVESVDRLLKYGGKFFVCYDANRTAELLACLKKHSLEPKRMFFTFAQPDKNATLVFVESQKHAESGCVVLPPFITNDKDGNYVSKIIENYKRKK